MIGGTAWSMASGPAAQVAQLVEHATENRSVGGSIPPLGTISSEIRRGGGSPQGREASGNLPGVEFLAYDAIRCLPELVLVHRTLAGAIRQVQMLGDDSIETMAKSIQPCVTHSLVMWWR